MVELEKEVDFIPPFSPLLPKEMVGQQMGGAAKRVVARHRELVESLLLPTVHHLKQILQLALWLDHSIPLCP